MNNMTFKSKLLMKLLQNSKGATLRVTFPDGTQDSFGAGEPIISVRAHNWRVFDELIDKGDLGMAEAIIRGDLEVDDIAALVQWACDNEDAVNRLLHGTWYGTLFARLRHLMNPNTKNGAKKNIMAHYDLGNQFYSLWLDPSMTYSAGLFDSSSVDLQQAQMKKYDRIIDALDIRAGDHVLEIGCGWGGFFSRAVERTGCRVTAVMNSPSQAQYNRELIARSGFGNQVELRQQDYREIEGRYDKIVSIEMIEAVGEKYWPEFFNKVSSSLKDKGSALIQSITIQDQYFEQYRRKTDFIQRYVFPGGMLLSNQVFDRYASQFDLKNERPFEFGVSYADTLLKWKENFHAVEADVRQMGFDDKFMRLWDLYLSYCEGAFRAERINVGHYLLQK
ncbi:SAM-dependent methyltransferase [Bdellovibrio sp. ZAP7]|uniref:SAM-dependent methyltransferase n=1 Tax=Bdellovibrio sp. ZAP7 TaxID=2231053 RepID=UPI00115BE211|nr:cyclopropane-fatty-acyl-phospholipid synthase family protein [Bdellovibrio sp. ZAP7]QDK44595.1 SAM-dependent methyltransferase [Bdellovibrio sp. ZAP7]